MMMMVVAKREKEIILSDNKNCPVVLYLSSLVR